MWIPLCPLLLTAQSIFWANAHTQIRYRKTKYFIWHWSIMQIKHYDVPDLCLRKFYLVQCGFKECFFLLTKCNIKVLLLKIYNIGVLLVPHLVDVCPMYRGWSLPLAQIWIKPVGLKCVSSPFLSTIPVCLYSCPIKNTCSLKLKYFQEIVFHGAVVKGGDRDVFLLHVCLIDTESYDPAHSMIQEQMDRVKTKKNTCLGLVGASLFPSQIQGEHLFACSVTSPFISDAWRGPGSKWDGQ